MADPTLYLYTSLTAGSSHIITATSRMETILKANKLPFRAIDCATDEKARQLWGRRSKGKKIPGLVKYGQVIADLEQVEEWNEFGELVEQIEDVSDLFGDTPMTDTPLPPPVNTLPPNPLKPIVETPAGMPPQISRASSETRHISIAEPADKKEKADLSAAPAPKGVVGATPLAMALRQAGVEAAAKAGQKKAEAVAAIRASESKASATKASEATLAPEIPDSVADTAPTTKKIDPSETTPNPAQTKTSPDALLDTTSEEEKQSITAAKTPTQLEAEGVKNVGVDKSLPVSEAAAAADTSDDPPLTSMESSTEPKSTEEQVLDMRRNSSITKTKSSLSKETSIDEIPSEDGGHGEAAKEKVDHEQAAAQAVTNVKRDEAPEKAKALPTDDSIPESDVITSSTVPAKTVESTDDVSTSLPKTTGVPTGERLHRGSSLSEAPDEEIKEIERKNAIIEESEEEEHEDEDDKAEAEVQDDKRKVETKSPVSAKAAKDDNDEGETKSPVTAKEAPTTIDKEVPEQTATATKVSASDEQEEKVVKDSKPQETKAAEPADADKSVGD